MASGIVALKNLKTDRVYLFFADDIQKENTRIRFELDLGMFNNKELQTDYTQTGLEVFRFDTILETNDPKQLDNIKKQFKYFY